MAAFNEVFDVTKLEDEQLGHMAWVLNSPSYSDVFEPHLRKMRNSLNARLLDPSQTRKDEFPDDFLRGGIVMVDGLLALFKKLLEETEVERIARSMQTLPDKEQYEKLRQEGNVRPMTGVVKRDYDPEEDF